MIYLNHQLLTTDRIIQYVKDNQSTLIKPSEEESKTPSELKKFQNTLKSIFFKKNLSNEDILSHLASDSRFVSYPKLKAVIEILLNLETPSEIETAIRQIDALEMNDWVFSPDKFDEYNQRYHYFSPENPETRILFEELSKTCRAQIVFFEQKNTEDDNLAYDYAYKIMALYVSSEGLIPDNLYTLIHQLMESVYQDTDHPLHELFMVKLHDLPLASTIEDRAGWSLFIKKEKIRALPFFLDAAKIEKQSSRMAPKNLSEANDILLHCQYQRATEDLAFARLCQRHRVSEERFNLCLDYMASAWPKKTRDDIPDLMIQGQGIASHLIWVKLPVADKRGLILGDITDCCQSIGGDAEDCVKDAVSLKSNGLYVLLKQKRKGTKPVIIDDEINEQDYKIIGQSYVWKSVFGNICLDSLECLKDEVSKDVLQMILSDFAKRLLADNPDINSVNLGRGSRTPPGIFPHAKITELILEGTPFDDSAMQYCILSSKPDLYVREYRKNLYSLLTLHTAGLLNPANRDAVLSHPKLDEIVKTLINLKGSRLLIKKSAQTNFEALLRHPSFDRIQPTLEILAETDLFYNDCAAYNFLAACKHPSPDAFGLIIKTINEADLLGGEDAQKNFDAVLRYQSPVEFLSMRASNVLLSGQAHRPSLLRNRSPYNLASALGILANAGLLGQTHFDALLRHQSPIFFALNRACAKSLADRDIIQRYQSPRTKFILNTLASAGLLNGEHGQANFDAVIRHQNLDCLFDNIHIDIKTKTLLNQTRFEELLLKKTRKRLYSFFENDIPESAISIHHRLIE